jgi:2'-5' RNA ligase
MTADALPYADATALADHWWWRPGWQVGSRFYSWHLTIGGQPELRALVRAYQDVLAPMTIMDVVPERWLHITTQGLGHCNEITDADRDAIVSAVSGRLSELPAATMTFHRPVLHREAVVIPPTDPEPLREVKRAIQAGMREVWSADRIREDPDAFRPHVSAAYLNATGDPRPVRDALDQVDAPPVTTTLHVASLIVMHRDHRMYEWTTHATAPIGRALPS